jgi:DNA-binding response OmpR family regulator
MNILILDDNPVMTMVLTDHFADRGHSVIPAYDAKLGLLFCDRKYFDVIIMDYVMPGLNGIEVLEIMRKKNKSTRAIIITGFPELLQEQSARLAKLDVEAVIEKPFDFSELDELIEKQAM